MSRYRIEVHNGRHLLCGGSIPADIVRPGQVWIDSGNTIVTVQSINGEWVTYTWTSHGEVITHTKDNFSFQCRYCLETSTIPEELK